MLGNFISDSILLVLLLGAKTCHGSSASEDESPAASLTERDIARLSAEDCLKYIEQAETERKELPNKIKKLKEKKRSAKKELEAEESNKEKDEGSREKRVSDEKKSCEKRVLCVKGKITRLEKQKTDIDEKKEKHKDIVNLEEKLESCQDSLSNKNSILEGITKDIEVKKHVHEEIEILEKELEEDNLKAEEIAELEDKIAKE